MKHTRKRYQHGSLTTEKRKKGPAVWVYRWREADTDGKQVNRKVVVGSKVTFPNKSTALAAVQGMQLEINKETTAGIYKPLSIGQLVIHYRETELAESNPHKTAGTKYVYGQHLDTYILPKWQDIAFRTFEPCPWSRGLANYRWLLLHVLKHGISSLRFMKHAMRLWVGNSQPDKAGTAECKTAD